MLTIGTHYNVNSTSKLSNAPKFAQAQTQPYQPYPSQMETQGCRELVQEPKRSPSILHQFGDLIFKPDYWKEDSQEDDGSQSTAKSPSRITFLA